MSHRGSFRLVAGALALTSLVAFAGCSATPTSTPTGPGSTAGANATAAGSNPGTTLTPANVAPELSALKVVAGERPHFEDDKGREVLLRGVNVNSFGQYFQADPALASTVPVADKDWESMAALGFSAVRFIVTWSGIEPQKGTYDQAYIDTVRAGIEAAGRHGIYVVVDMHQDAWSQFVASPPGTTCEEGSEPAIGWDGAPKWATAVEDPAGTCRAKGARELSKVVGNSFAAFYTDAGGVRSSLVNAWGHLAGALADEQAVIGYDLFNEPNPSGDAPTTLAQYTSFLTDTITTIRAAEAKAGVAPRIAFVEPIVTWPLPNTAPPAGFTPDKNVAFAPHNYFGSLNKILTPEQGFYANTTYAKTLGAAMWTGEYGWWDDGQTNMAALRRFAKAEDAAIAGGAWWQWRQACGDPHTLNNPERSTSDQLHLNGVGCPGDKDKGVTKAYALVLSRPYPRAAPGTITSLTSDPDARTMDLVATNARSGGELSVWVPAGAKGEPKVTAAGVKDLKVSAVAGGFRVTGTTACSYHVSVDGPDASATPPPAC